MIVQCNCEKCRVLCHGHPGRFDPGQVAAAAKHMNLSVREFFNKFLTVDFWTAESRHDQDVRYLSPAWMDDHKGGEASWGDAFKPGSCALLGPDGCSLPLHLRPRECAIASGCSKSREHFNVVKFAKSWDTDEAKRELEEVSGA